MLRRLFFTFLAIFTVFCLLTSASYAQCIPGIPCVTAATANDPNDDTDGPNIGGAPNSTKSDSAACDADFMNQIYARAFIEASREQMMTQTIVKRPDSVLEYTCFDQIARDTAEFAGPIFTESERWKEANIPNPGGDTIQYSVTLGDEKLDGSIDKLVIEPLKKYGDDNFAHRFLDRTGTDDHSFPSSVSGAGSACNKMNGVYLLAKCNNFGLEDMFREFDDFTGFDPRTITETCSVNPITADIINVAKNQNFDYVSFDSVITHSKLLENQPCGDPISTGLTVSQVSTSVGSSGNISLNEKEFDEYTCINPGCYYRPSGSGVGSCVPN